MRRRAQDDTYPQKRAVKEGRFKDLRIPLQIGINKSVLGPLDLFRIFLDLFVDPKNVDFD